MTDSPDAAQARYPKLVTPAEAAEVLRVTPAHVRRLIAEGVLAAVNVGTKKRPRWVIFESEVLAFIEARSTCAGFADEPDARIEGRAALTGVVSSKPCAPERSTAEPVTTTPRRGSRRD